MKYLKIENHYLPILPKLPSKVYKLSEEVYQLVYEEGKPTERIEEVSKQTLESIGEIVDEKDK